VGLSYNGSVNTLLGSPVAIPNATPSSSPTTGALTVGGGVGIGGTLSASKKIQIGNLITGGATAELLISSSDPTGVSQIAIGDGDSRNLGFLWYNSASGFQPSSAHVSTYGYNWPLFFDASALSLQVNCGMPTTIGGKLAVTINTPSTSASNGAIVVGGGVGIGGQVSADGGFACTGPVASTNALKARGSGSNIFIGANGNGIAAPPGTAGIILVNDSSVNGKAAVLVIGAGGTSVLGGAAGHVWNATTTPAANTFGFGWDGTNWKIYNGFASAVQFTSLSISLT
jgi:hypothetical protein